MWDGLNGHPAKPGDRGNLCWTVAEHRQLGEQEVQIPQGKCCRPRIRIHADIRVHPKDPLQDACVHGLCPLVPLPRPIAHRAPAEVCQVAGCWRQAKRNALLDGQGSPLPFEMCGKNDAEGLSAAGTPEALDDQTREPTDPVDEYGFPRKAAVSVDVLGFYAVFPVAAVGANALRQNAFRTILLDDLVRKRQMHYDEVGVKRCI